MNPSNFSSDTDRSAFRDPSIWGATAFGTIISLAITGYAFPDNNNVFHLPIVGELYNLPEFANDPYIQSLRYFASGLWMILAGSARWIEPRHLFLVLLVTSRALSLIGFLLCADRLGIRGAKARYFFAALVSTTTLMQIDSVAGGGGLFIRNFTHSEIPNGLFLIALWAVLSNRFVLALALIGPTFFVNAFFGVWLAFVLFFSLLNEIVSGRQRILGLIPAVCIGGVVGILFAIPVLRNVISNPDFGMRPDFNYIEYLKYYYYEHFLFSPIETRAKISLVLVISMALLALRHLPDPQKRILVIICSCILLYLIGIFVPFLTSNPMIINLHLLRSSTLIQLLAVLLAYSVLTQWWFSNNSRNVVLASLAMIGMAFVPFGPLAQLRKVLIGTLPVVFALQYVIDRYPGSWFATLFNWRKGLVRPVSLVTLTAVAGVTVILNQSRLAKDTEWIAEWDKVGAWARAETAPGSVFLVPAFSLLKKYPERDFERNGASFNSSFEYTSHRSLWVDFKRGADVLWSPSDYHRWYDRTLAVEPLSTHQERLNYAIANDIPYVIEITTGECSGEAVFRTKRICVFHSKP